MHRTRGMRLLVAAALLWTSVAAPAIAAVTGSGDLAAEVLSPAFGGEAPPTFQLLDNSGQFKASLPLLGAAPVFGANDHIVYLRGQIRELDSSLTLVRTITPPFVPSDLAVGSNGDFGGYIVFASHGVETGENSLPRRSSRSRGDTGEVP